MNFPNTQTMPTTFVIKFDFQMKIPYLLMQSTDK